MVNKKLITALNSIKLKLFENGVWQYKCREMKDIEMGRYYFGDQPLKVGVRATFDMIATIHVAEVVECSPKHVKFNLWIENKKTKAQGSLTEKIIKFVGKPNEA